MGAASVLKGVYDLDTLDTRFTNPSSVAYKTVIDARSDPYASREPASKASSRAQPSKWNTPEFYLYYAVFIVVIPYMFWIAYDVSRRSLDGTCSDI
jgi:protein-cysteine N-palmitoyltransferase HHAT